MRRFFLEPHTGRYLTVFILPGLFVAMAIFVSYAFLIRTGEFKTTVEIADHILKTDGRYGTGLHPVTRQLKLEIYRRVKPDVVAFGSSRALQFQAGSFQSSFLSLGSLASGPVESLQALKEMFAIHKPAFLVYTVDFWWFHGQFPEPFLRNPHNRNQTSLQPRLTYFVKTWLRLFSGKIPWSDFFSVLFGSEHRNVGSMAVVWNDGFDRYGTYYYESIITGQRESEDIGFADTRKILGAVLDN